MPPTTTSGLSGTSIAVVADENKLGRDHRWPLHCLALSAQRQGIHCHSALHIVRGLITSFPVKHPPYEGAARYGEIS